MAPSMTEESTANNWPLAKYEFALHEV